MHAQRESSRRRKNRRMRPRAHLGVLAAAGATLLLAAPAAAQWYWQQPRPQGYTLRSVYFVDADNGTAAGDQGTILQTSDGGETWTIRDSGIPLQGNFSNVRFADSTTGIAVGAYPDLVTGSPTGFIVRTTDGGTTWTTVHTVTATLVYDVAFADADTVIATGVNFQTAEPVILRSGDGGVTWESQTADFLGVITAVTFTGPTTGIAVGFDLAASTSVILRTVDGGATWETQSGGTEEWLNAVAFADPLTGMAVGNAGTVVVTTDGGVTWETRASGTTLDLLGISYVDSAVVVGGDLAGGGGGIILTSSDHGASWTAQGSRERLDGVYFSDADTGVAVGRGGEILRTADGGASWVRRSERLTDESLRGLSFPDGLTGTAVGTGGTILRTLDGGSTWIAQDSGTTLDLYGVSFVDASHGMAVGGDLITNERVILGTSDGGDTWLDLTPPDLPLLALHDVACIGAGTCTVVGHCGLIVRTDDGGASWTTQRSADCVTQPRLLGVSFTDAQTGTAVGRNTILRTTDGGETWTPQESPTDQVLRDVVFVDAETGVVVGGHQANKGTILHTTDGGATWEVRRGDLPSNLNAVDFADADHGVAVSLGGDFYRTENGGESWLLEQEESGNLYAVALHDATTGIAAGWGHGQGFVFRTVGGPTFPLGLSPSAAAICLPEGGTEEAVVDVRVEGVAGYTGAVELSTAGEPAGVTSELVPDLVAVPGAASWQLTFDGSVAAGRHVLTLTGDDGTQQQFATLRLEVVDAALAPTLAEPADGATDVGPRPTFTWEPIFGVDTYRIQVATDGELGDVVIDAEVEGTAFTPLGDLELDTQYFWRVRGLHDCGGAWSDVFSFTTEPRPLPVLAFDPSAVAFGDVPVGTTGPPRIATLSNTGDADATGLGFDPLGAGFAADTTGCGAVLAAGASCEVSVTFAPTEPGPAVATLHAASSEGATADLDLTGNGVAAGVVTPTALEVDPVELSSNGNGVFEPGEMVIVAPWWRNDGSLPESPTGTASHFVGPMGVPHTVERKNASYGTLDPGQAGSCLETDACYTLAVGDPAARPTTHWEAMFDEALDDPAGTGKTWTLHIGASFTDVAPTNLFYRSIETLLHHGVTDGCLPAAAEAAGVPAGRGADLEAATDGRDGARPLQGGAAYCPGAVNSRSQMPVFVLRALEGADYAPEACTEGAEEFADVPAANPFCPWIEELARRDVVAGCGDDSYCPTDAVTRAQMAVYLLKTLEGGDYTPPECSGRFADVACPSLFADWIEELAEREITGGCSESEYCPADPVSRAQMATFISRTFGLTLYGP